MKCPTLVCEELTSVMMAKRYEITSKIMNMIPGPDYLISISISWF